MTVATTSNKKRKKCRAEGAARDRAQAIHVLVLVNTGVNDRYEVFDNVPSLRTMCRISRGGYFPSIDTS